MNNSGHIAGSTELPLRGYYFKSGSLPNQALERQPVEDVHSIVDPERRLVVVTFGNKLTLSGIQRYTERLLANPSFHRTFSEIADLRNVEEMDLSADEFLKLADKIDPFSAEAKRAFVVRTSTQNHAARMHRALRTTRNIEIFHSVEEAEQWIRGGPVG